MTRGIALAAALAALALPGAATAAVHANGPIAFSGAPQRGLAGQGNGIWAWKAGWKGLRHITTDPADIDPQGSPDGRWIVFTRLGDVFRARNDGSRVIQVTSSGPAFDRAPSFSPSGKRILFSRTPPQPPGQPEDVLVPEHIYSVKLDGTGLQQLTTGDVSDRDPVFSPNGKIIAFDRKYQTSSRHVFTMRPDGGRAKDATPFLANWSREPAFNPTGSRIVYVRGSYGSTRSDLFTIRPDGKKLRRLTGRSGHPLGGVSGPSWSPDGTRVVFEHKPRGRFTKLQIVRVRDRHLGVTLGGPKFTQSPNMFAPTWLSG